jgi:hypothetical protein
MLIKDEKLLIEWKHEDVSICERLIKAYNNTKNQNRGEFSELVPDDLWSAINEDSKISEFNRLLDSNDATQLSHYFVKYWNIPRWFGGIDVVNSPDNYNGRYNFDELIKFLKTINVDFYPYDTTDSAVDRIINFLDIDIIPPPVISSSGLKTKNGLLHYRHLNSLYLSLWIKKFTNSSHNICEYGGGLGLNAYYLYKMNRKNVYLFDLPFVNMISAYFLIKALGHDAVVLEGEDSKPDTIHINAFWNCQKYGKDFFEVTANQDSFPEIDNKIVEKYLAFIFWNTKSYFLSINHEHEHQGMGQFKHLNISSMLSWLDDYHLISRIVHPLREGYFEELYKINKI